MGKLLTLDLSTTATGTSVFDLETKELLEYGVIKPSSSFRGIPYPKQQLFKMQDIAYQITKYADSIGGLERIAIEEVNRGIARLTQKTLDGLHFILMDRLDTKIELVYYKDSDGSSGWRTELGLLLTDADKLLNKDRRAVNAKLGPKQKKFPIINKKHLACRLVNRLYGHILKHPLDCDLRETDGDIADAIGLGHAILAKI